MTTIQLLQTAKRAVCAVALCALAFINASATATVSIDGTTATVTLEAAGDWAAYVGTATSLSDLSEDFSSVTKVVFTGDAEFNSDDAAETDVLFNGTITFIDMSDLSSVYIGSLWSQQWSYSAPSVLLPAGVGYDASPSNYITWSSAFFSYTDDAKTAVKAYGTDFSGIETLRAENDALTTLYICGSFYASGASAAIASADVEGIDNIILRDAEANGTMSLIGLSNIPTNYTHTKCLILEQDVNNQRDAATLTENYAITGSLVLIGWLNGNDVLQARFLQKGVAADFTLPEDDQFENAAYYGEVNYADLVYFSNAEHTGMSLYGITYSQEDTETGVTGNFVTDTKDWTFQEKLDYLVLPNLQTEATDPYLENFIQNGKARETDPGLKAVAYFDTGSDTDADGNVTARNKFYEAQTEPGGLAQIINLFPNGISNTTLISAKHLSVAGHFNASDLAYERAVDDNGHLKLDTDCTTQLTINYTYKTSTESTDQVPHHFTNLTSLDLSKALLTFSSDAEKETAQNDVCISQLGFASPSYLASIEFPRDENFYYIPDGCLAISGMTNMRTICLPQNIKRIGTGAFDTSNDAIRIIYAEVPSNATGDGYDNFSPEVGETIYMIDGLPFTKAEKDEIVASVDDSGNIPAVSRTSDEGIYTIFDGITYTTEKFEAIKENYVEEDEISVTLPPYLTRIGKAAFWGIQPYDVFVLNEGDVPYCEPWAFQVVTYMGNNGYNPGTIVTKVNYHNDNNRMGQLHYPSGLSEAKVKLYKDITRVYSLSDGLQTTDGDGNVLSWPTQTEWITAYTQGTTGYLWNDWTNLAVLSGNDINNLYTTVLSDENKEDVGPIIVDINTSPNTFAPYNSQESDNGYREQEETYIGWHQFVLAYGNNYYDPDPVHTFSISDNNWWTIYSPFSMTKAEIKEAYGDETNVCYLKRVTRFEDEAKYTYTENGKETSQTMAAGSIVLGFGENLMEAEGVEDTTTIIKAQTPYMIKPSIFDGDNGSPTIYITTAQETQKEEAGTRYTASEHMTKVPASLIRNATATELSDDAVTKNTDGTTVTVTVTDTLTYIFLGTLSTATYYIPQYAYYLGWNSAKEDVAYYYQKVIPNAGVRNWNPYTCVVMPVGNGGDDYDLSNISWYYETDAANAQPAHWYFSKHENSIYDAYTDGSTPDFYGVEDSLGDTSSSSTSTASKMATLLFDVDGTLTAIDHITPEGSFVEAEVVSGAVYSLSGVKVAESFNANALAKGIYIVGGKKIAVK